MEYVRLGKTGMLVSRAALGAESLAEGDGALVRAAYSGGVNFFDAARASPKAEALLGESLKAARENVFVATKTRAMSAAEVLADADSSLAALSFDSIDLLQYETQGFVPLAGGRDGIYSALDSLKSSGKVKRVGIATQDYETAAAAVKSGLYETLQFPFNMLCPVPTLSIVDLCARCDVGFLAMQPLCGGIISNMPLALGFLRQYENVVPLWGARSLEELGQIFYFNERPPAIDAVFKADVEKIRAFFA